MGTECNILLKQRHTKQVRIKMFKTILNVFKLKPRPGRNVV
jgi:hypothetical protein